MASIEWIKGMMEGRTSFTFTINFIEERKHWIIMPTISMTFTNYEVPRIMLKQCKFGRFQIMPKKYWTIRGLNSKDKIRFAVEGVMPCKKFIKLFGKEKFETEGFRKKFDILKEITIKLDRGEHLTKKGFLEMVRLKKKLEKLNHTKRRPNYKKIMRQFKENQQMYSKERFKQRRKQFDAIKKLIKTKEG